MIMQFHAFTNTTKEMKPVQKFVIFIKYHINYRTLDILYIFVNFVHCVYSYTFELSINA